MASTTYRVIQEPAGIGRVTKEQVARVIREFLAAEVKKPAVAAKSGASLKARPIRSKR